MSQGLLWWSSVRLQAPNTGNMDSVPGWGRKIPHAPQQRERKKDLFPHLYPQKALYIHIYICVCVCVYIYIYVLEMQMAAHSSILAWRIPWTEQPGGLVYGVAESRTRLSN